MHFFQIGGGIKQVISISKMATTASKVINEKNPRVWAEEMRIPGMGSMIIKNYKYIKNENERKCVCEMIELIASLLPEDWDISEGDVAVYLTKMGFNMMVATLFDMEKQDDDWKKSLTKIKNNIVRLSLKWFQLHH